MGLAPGTILVRRNGFESVIEDCVAPIRGRDRKIIGAVVVFRDVGEARALALEMSYRVGDELLRSVAVRLQCCVRTSDTVCRRGGDEFLVLLFEIAHLDDAACTREKLMASIASPHLVAGRELNVSASIGISVYPTHGFDTEALLASADRVMYSAKQDGRHREQSST